MPQLTRSAAAPGLGICRDARLLRANESAHELVADVGRGCVNVDVPAVEEFASVFYIVDARGLDSDCPETGSRGPHAIVVFIERAGDAADREQHAPANLFRDCAARHHVRRFGRVEHRDYKWRRSYAVASFAAYLGTRSDHLLLPEARRAELLSKVQSDLPAVVEADWVTNLYVAQVA
jgi:hypothetical protein